jgi:regulator of protease activity HflC (stomatin/prohibitin superfamily)
MKQIQTLTLMVFTTLLSACTQIDTGNVGVERTLGKVGVEAMPPGIYLTVFKTVDEFTSKEVLFQLDNMTPKSRDNLTMQDMDLDIIYKVDGSRVPELYAKYQGDIVKHGQVVNGGSSDLIISHSRVVREAREAVYKTVAGFDATTMHTKRTEITEAVRKTLQTELDVADKGAFTVTSVNVRNLVVDKGLEDAIRQKAATDQRIEQAQRELALTRAEAEKAIAKAEGEARANQIIAASITAPLIRMREIEAQRDAAIAIAGKAGNTVLLGGGSATPLVQVR